MKIHTKAVHTGDRKKLGSHVPVTTPIYTASAYSYDSMEQLDRIFGEEEEGPCYARYETPSSAALEELVSALESGHGAQSCASGMAAIHLAVIGRADRPAPLYRCSQRHVRRDYGDVDERVRTLGRGYQIRRPVRPGCLPRGRG